MSVNVKPLMWSPFDGGMRADTQFQSYYFECSPSRGWVLYFDNECIGVYQNETKATERADADHRQRIELSIEDQK